MSNVIDLTGRRFGRLTVVKQVGRNKDRRVVWECTCDCGNIIHVQSHALLRSNTRSCGCLQKQITAERSTKHGLCYTPLYHIFSCMHTRCYNANRHDYQWYGARGIKICDEWLNSFTSFYEWAMSHGYKEGLTIDRINSDKDYCPENCRWVTRLEQVRNTSRNRVYTYNGETHCMSEWATIMGIKYFTLRSRLDRGWSIEKALRGN